jgi:ribonuclease HII
VIDEVNILQATRRAMQQAAGELQPGPEFLLVDALNIPDIPIRQFPIIKGDCLSISIACASIIAKVDRDQLMRTYDDLYPGYGFANHKGYGTREHLTSLMKKGPSPIHRLSFEPVKSRFGSQTKVQLNLFE